MQDPAQYLHSAILAPSGHNTQPWRFTVTDDHIDLYADRTRALPVVDPDDRELIMSCGAALFNLRLAMLHDGRGATPRLFPDPDHRDLLARIPLDGSRRATGTEEQLFQTIPLRRTNRHKFEARPVPAVLLETAMEAARQEGAWLAVVSGEENRHALAGLVAEGDRIQGADSKFRRELAHWIHSNRSHSQDGMPGYAFGVGDLLSYGGPFVIRTFDWGKGQAAMDRQLVEGSPVLAVLGTDLDFSGAWLASGQALQHILLLLQAQGVSASFLNQPVEVPRLRPRLGSLLGAGGFPQLVLRFGYGPEVRATPRRGVEQTATIEACQIAL